MKFPSKKVAQITSTSIPVYRNAAPVHCVITLKQLRQLVEIKAANPKEAQNAAPSISEFLADLTPFEDKVKLIGYIVYPPRNDARVSIEGFTCSNLSGDQTIEMLKDYWHADERDADKQPDGSYNVRFWWD